MTEITTIQVEREVYDRLSKEKAIKESFNDVLRRLLGMDKVPEFEPVSYRGQIIMRSVGIHQPDIQDIMSQFDRRDIDHYGKYIPRTMTIKGVHNVLVKVNTNLTLSITAYTKEEVREAFNAILEGRNLKVETNIRGLIYSN